MFKWGFLIDKSTRPEHLKLTLTIFLLQKQTLQYVADLVADRSLQHTTKGDLLNELQIYFLSCQFTVKSDILVQNVGSERERKVQSVFLALLLCKLVENVALRAVVSQPPQSGKKGLTMAFHCPGSPGAQDD